MTPAYLREVADGLAHQNSHYERVAARFAASADLLDALYDLLALHLAHHNHPTHAAARAAITKAERPQP